MVPELGGLAVGPEYFFEVVPQSHVVHTLKDLQFFYDGELLVLVAHPPHVNLFGEHFDVIVVSKSFEQLLNGVALVNPADQPGILG